MRTTTRTEMLTTWTLNLKGFNPARGVCAILAVGLVAFVASTPSALAAAITVGNHSFETEGTFTSGAWYQLPDGGSWGKGLTNLYQIVDTSIANPHFTAGNAPEGNNVLNLQTASPLTQGLSHAVSIGDLVTMSFYLGNSTGQADPPASPTATLTLDGSDAHSEIVNNDAADGAFVLKTVQWTATSAGNLGIKFTSGAGCWIDNISVDVTTPMAPDDTSVSGSLMLWAKDAAGTYSGGTWTDSSGRGKHITTDVGTPVASSVTPAIGPFDGETIATVSLPDDSRMSALAINGAVGTFTNLTIISVFKSSVIGNSLVRPYGVGSKDATGTGEDRINPASDATIRYDDGFTPGTGPLIADLMVRATRLKDGGGSNPDVVDDWLDTGSGLMQNITNQTVASSRGYASPDFQTESDNFYLGELASNTTAAVSDIAQIAVYNAALTDQQIAEISAWMIVYGDGVLPAPAGSIVWSDLSTTNITATSAWPTATVNTNTDVTVLVWDSVDHAPGTTNDWPVANRMSLGPKSAGVVTAQITGLSADSNVVWRIYGENSETNGWSAATSFVTALSSAQAPVFTNATALSFSAIQLGWQDKASNETAYLLYRSSGGGYQLVATLPANTTSYQDDSVDASTTYTYRLAATNDTNGSSTDFAACQSSSVTTPAITWAKATGGTVTNDYTDTNGVRWVAHIFTDVGVNTLQITRSGQVEYLIVAGGGGGGGSYNNTGAGGGGAGGLLEGTTTLTGAEEIVVGDGGDGISGGNVNGENGDLSEAFGLTAIGGGGGAGTRAENDGSDGGSGGGGADSYGGGLSTATGQGNGGGDSSTITKGGGGGGAGGVGDSGASGGAGGAGVTSSITGTSVEYAAGGNGGIYDVSVTNGDNGGANTGQGGDGSRSAGGASSAAAGGKGGSGIVVVRYQVPPTGTLFIFE